jgi:hypothetical protein
VTAQHQRAALSPQRPIDHHRFAIRREIAAGRDNKSGACAVFFQSLRRERVSDQSAVSELADAARENLGIPQQLRQLRNIRRNPSCLVFGEQLCAAERRPGSSS